MKTLVLAAVLLAGSITSVLADFYIVQEPTSRRCRIVEERPAPGVGVVIGDRFGARLEAENHMRTVEVCREGTTGRGDGVTIEERRAR